MTTGAAKSATPDDVATPRIHGGRVVFLYGFDIAYDTKRVPIKTLLGQPVESFVVDVSKRMPRQLFFYRPAMVRLPTATRQGPHGPVTIERTIKLFPVGAISVSLAVRFERQTFDDLVAYHDLAAPAGVVHEEAMALAEQVRKELEPFCIRPLPAVRDEEAYTVFCIEGRLGDGSAERWLSENRRRVAALLTQEPDINALSEQEADDSAGSYLSYYEHDMVVADWDAALIVDEPHSADQTLYVMELANVQLAELEAYDMLLDEVIDKSYPGLSRRPLRQVIKGLREIRIDLARLDDELSNITKFFGDWHLARVYQRVAQRFHLDDWRRTLNQKLRTLDSLYQLVKQDQTNRWMIVLESAIVLLFIIDLVAIFGGFAP